MEENDFQIHDNPTEGMKKHGVSLLAMGLGGAGCNALLSLQKRQLDQLHLYAVDADDQALRGTSVARRHLLGKPVLRGLGSGGDPEMGARAAEEDHEALSSIFAGHEMVFLCVGMGGGTGGGAAPVLARLAEAAGCLVIAFVTLPFSCEGARRRQQAEEAVGRLRGIAHAVIPLPNDLLLQEVKEEESLAAALRVADEWMARGVVSVWRMLHWRGILNIDFAALEKMFGRKGGKALYGLGWGEGEDAAREALRNLDLCPLLQSPEFSRWADRLLINVVGGPDLRMHDVRMLIDEMKSKFGPEAFVTAGAVQSDEFIERVEVCVIGTTDVHGGRGASRRNSRGVEGSEPTRRPKRNERKESPVDTQLEPPPTVVAAQQQGGEISQDNLIFDQENSGVQREFPFEDDKRGHFDRTDKNLWAGVDLDTPTYQRKGIRIAL